MTNPINPANVLVPQRPLRAALPLIRFFEAVNWGPKHIRRDKIDLIVLHCMESADESLDRAERSALWMAGKNPKFPPPRSSAHYFVDPDSIVQGVLDEWIAWHAPGANRQGIGIEHAGKAKQTETEWLDEAGIAMLDLSTQLTARLCQRWNIPTVYLEAPALLAGQRGITTHRQVTLAWKKGSHMDPGPSFPIGYYMARVNAYAEQETRFREA